MSGLGFWPLATILGMSEVKLGSPGFYKAQKALHSQDPEIGHKILDPSGGRKKCVLSYGKCDVTQFFSSDLW